MPRFCFVPCRHVRVGVDPAQLRAIFHLACLKRVVEPAREMYCSTALSSLARLILGVPRSTRKLLVLARRFTGSSGAAHLSPIAYRQLALTTQYATPHKQLFGRRKEYT